MNRSLWQKKIPSILGIILILISIGITSFLVRNQNLLITKASPKNSPQNIRITNITDSSFTVSYKTKEQSVGIIKYGKDNNLANMSTDENIDKEDIFSFLHYTTVKNLEPKSKYFFLIKSDDEEFLNDEKLFEITTAEKTEEIEEAIELSGKLILPNGNQPEKAIVYLASENSETISTLAKKGEYKFNSPLKDKKLLSYLTDFNKDFKILAVSDFYDSEIIINPNELKKIPQIILSKNYDFTVSELPAETLSSEIKFPSYSVGVYGKKSDPDVLTPKQNEKFKDLRPLFTGSASPSAEIEIIINSEEEIITKVKADSKGLWSFRPQESLSPGKHTVTVKTKDRFGILKTIKRSFTVYAQGSQVSETATPSATPKISLSPTSPLLTFTPSPTAPIFIPTSTPFPTQAIIIPTKPPPPQAGSSQTITLAVASVSIAAFGLFLFLLSRGNISL